MAEAVNDAIHDAQVRHQVYLTRFSSGLVRKIITLLNAVDDDLVAQILRKDPTGTGGNWSAKRLRALLDSIREINRDAFRQVEQEMRGQIGGLAVYEAGFQAKLIDGILPVAIDIATPAAAQLKAAVLARPFQGHLLKDWVKGMETGRFARLRQSIQLGLVEGQTIDQIVRRVRGTRAKQFKDGILDISRRGAEAMVRTAVNHTATYARELLYQENPDLIEKVMWVSTLDNRTTPICRARDGKVFPVGKGPRPPAHINCRSTTTPVVKSWRDLGIDLDEAPKGTRASMGGQVPAELTYNDWLKKQSAEFQDDVLGVKRGKLFRDGGLSMDSFVDLGSGREYTLAELENRESAAFRKAGL